MGPLVCMSLEEMERSVSTERVAALTTHQDCGDVLFLTPVETCRASTSTSAMTHQMVDSLCPSLYRNLYPNRSDERVLSLHSAY